jgi:23S rRNA (uridine2552-2'-O)-methyltransferase
VAAGKVGQRGKVVAVDLLEIAPIPGVTALRGDFREPALQAQLAAAAGGDDFDLVLSDLSPNLSGVASTDQARSAELVGSVLEFCRAQLASEGALLIKVFQGSDFPGLVAEAKRVFRKVTVIKPGASRGESREVYLLSRHLKH